MLSCLRRGSEFSGSLFAERNPESHTYHVSLRVFLSKRVNFRVFESLESSRVQLLRSGALQYDSTMPSSRTTVFAWTARSQHHSNPSFSVPAAIQIQQHHHGQNQLLADAEDEQRRNRQLFQLAISSTPCTLHHVLLVQWRR